VRYINRLKVEKACQMLQSGDISPSLISDFLNFYSLPYFYKVFKEYTGMTPHQYRNSQDL
jgi:two-component system response regulator YesN